MAARAQRGREGTVVVVRRREGDTLDTLLRRFKKRCKKERILSEARHRLFYTPPSKARRDGLRKHRRREDEHFGSGAVRTNNQRRKRLGLPKKGGQTW